MAFLRDFHLMVITIIASIYLHGPLAGALEDNNSSAIDTGNAFTRLIFDDVSELDLIQVVLGNPDTIDPKSRLPANGLLANLTELVSSTCLQDTATYLTDLLKFERYALQMRAANAQPIELMDREFTERLLYYGDFEVCQMVKIRSYYHGAAIDAETFLMTLRVSDYSLDFGVCCPQSCSTDDLGYIVTLAIREFGREEYIEFHSTAYPPVTFGFILSCFLIFAFLTLMAVGTAHDLNLYGRWAGRSEPCHSTEEEATAMKTRRIENGEVVIKDEEGATKDGEGATKDGEGATAKNVDGDESTPNEQNQNLETSTVVNNSERSRFSKVLLAFSLAKNGPAVLNLKRPKSSMGALDGIRVLSMVWIICHHVEVFWDHVMENRFFVSTTLSTKISSRLNAEGHLGVDSFFVLSALLVTYHTLSKKKANRGYISWWRFYLNRYLRLTPVYMFCILMFVSLSPMLGRGYIKYNYYNYEAQKCKAYIWSNLLYINNYIPHPVVLSECMGWSWYLANDMQMFATTPLFFFFMSRTGKEKIGVGLTIGVAVFSMLAALVIAVFFGVPWGNAYVPYNDNYVPYIEFLGYSHMFTRIQSYMVGVFIGYYLYRNKGRTIRIPKVWNALGWFLSISVCFTIVFAGSLTSYERPVPGWFAALWHGCNRFLFSCGVGWIAFACVTGNGAFINKLLSLDIWLPMSRVSYCVYLLHPVVMLHYITTSRDQLHLNTYTSLYMFTSFFAVTYLVSLVVSLLVEVPLLKLTKMMLERRAPRSD